MCMECVSVIQSLHLVGFVAGCTRVGMFIKGLNPFIYLRRKKVIVPNYQEEFIKLVKENGFTPTTLLGMKDSGPVYIRNLKTPLSKIKAFVKEANSMLGVGTINKENYVTDFAHSIIYLQELIGSIELLKSEYDKLENKET